MEEIARRRIRIAVGPRPERDRQAASRSSRRRPRRRGSAGAASPPASRRCRRSPARTDRRDSRAPRAVRGSTGGSSAPSFHSTVTRLLARLTRAPRTPSCLPQALLDRDDAGAAIDAVDDEIHRRDAFGGAANEKREVLRFRHGLLLVRGRVRDRQLVLAAVEPLGARGSPRSPASSGREPPAWRPLHS